MTLCDIMTNAMVNIAVSRLLLPVDLYTVGIAALGLGSFSFTMQNNVLVFNSSSSTI